MNFGGAGESTSARAAEQLLADQRKRWERKPLAFLRRMPSLPDGPLSYYREREGITFLLTLRVERVLEGQAELRLTAENQPGCLAFLRKPETRSVRFTVQDRG